MEHLRSAEQESFPTLSFGFTFDESTDSPRDIAANILNAIRNATRLNDYCNTTWQPSYMYNQNKRLRASRYFNQEVGRGSERCARKERVDVNVLAEQVVDNLAETNHPVAQAIAQLHCDAQISLPRAALQAVTLEVLIQTHWHELQDAYAQSMG